MIQNELFFVTAVIISMIAGVLLCLTAQHFMAKNCENQKYGQNTKKISITVPEEYYQEILFWAQEKRVHITKLIDKFIKLGILVCQSEKNGQNFVFIREQREDGHMEEIKITL